MKNIVIIIVDALRPKNLSLYGYSKETDSNLKRIAQESLVFDNHFSASNSTAPSLTSLFTAKYPSHHGIIHQFPYTTEAELEQLKKNKFWFPRFLQTKRYNTIAIDWLGMWFKKGFDYYEEKKEVPKPFLNNPIVKKILLSLPAWAYRLGKKMTKQRASTAFAPASQTMDLALTKIKESKKPFFLFMHFWDTHFPFPTVSYTGSSPKDIDKVLETIPHASQREYFRKRIADIGLYSIVDMIGKYDASIALVDKQIGRLYDFLKKEELWEETVFLVLGDHGDNLTEHGIYFSHSGLFDESIHVPLVAHFPGISGGKRISGMIQNIDIIPSLLDYLDFTKETFEKIDGRSFIPLIKKGKEIRERVLLFDGLSKNIRGVRTKKRKLIIAKDNQCHLCKAHHHEAVEEYDLEKDPTEQKNVFAGKSELMKFLNYI